MMRDFAVGARVRALSSRMAQTTGPAADIVEGQTYTVIGLSGPDLVQICKEQVAAGNGWRRRHFELVEDAPVVEAKPSLGFVVIPATVKEGEEIQFGRPGLAPFPTAEAAAQYTLDKGYTGTYVIAEIKRLFKKIQPEDVKPPAYLEDI